MQLELIPYGYCQCGCGKPTRLADETRPKWGWVKGKPLKYLRGHNRRQAANDYRIDPESGCWIWQLALGHNGYGRAWDGERQRLEVAHRLYYMRLVGPIPEGLEIDHLCRKRACVNPAHLELVTRLENVRRGHAARQ